MAIHASRSFAVCALAGGIVSASWRVAAQPIPPPPPEAPTPAPEPPADAPPPGNAPPDTPVAPEPAPPSSGEPEPTKPSGPWPELQPVPEPEPEPVPAPAPSRCGARKPGAHDVPAGELSRMSLQELLDITTTVASTRERSVFETPSTVAVIDRGMIERYDFRTVAEAVNTIAGFAVVRTSSRTNLPTSRWILQAHYPNKILLMINGVPTWKPVTGETTLGHVDIAAVERIEVLRGPSSVLYGTNAYAGAINIVLKCPANGDATTGSLYGGAGTWYALHGGGNIALRDGRLELFAAAGGYDEYGDPRRITDADGITGWYRDFRSRSSAVITAGYGPHSLLLNRYQEHQTKLGRDPTFAAGWGEPETLDGYLASYTYAGRVHDRVEVKAGATFDSNRRVFARENGYDARTSVIGHRQNAFARWMIELAGWSTLEVGADIDRRTSVEYRSFREQDDLTIDHSNLRDRTIYETSAYAQLEAEYRRLGVLAGARLTYNELFKVNLSSRATGVYAFDDDNSLKLIIGQSFRAPSLFELYFLNPERSLSGNPALQPETSTSFELAYLTSLRGIFVQALAYYATYAGAIYRRRAGAGDVLVDGMPPTGPARLYDNGDRYAATGVEVEYRAELGPLSSFGTYTFVRGIRGDVPTDAEYYNFDFVPHHKVVIGVSADVRAAFASLAAVYVSGMRGPVPDATGSTAIDGQLTLDATLGYEQALAGHRVRHVLAVKNLANTDTVYPEYVDLEMKEIPWGQTRRILYTFTIDL